MSSSFSFSIFDSMRSSSEHFKHNLTLEEYSSTNLFLEHFEQIIFPHNLSKGVIKCLTIKSKFKIQKKF